MTDFVYSCRAIICGKNGIGCGVLIAPLSAIDTRSRNLNSFYVHFPRCFNLRIFGGAVSCTHCGLGLGTVSPRRRMVTLMWTKLGDVPTRLDNNQGEVRFSSGVGFDQRGSAMNALRGMEPIAGPSSGVEVRDEVEVRDLWLQATPGIREANGIACGRDGVFWSSGKMCCAICPARRKLNFDGVAVRVISKKQSILSRIFRRGYCFGGNDGSVSETENVRNFSISRLLGIKEVNRGEVSLVDRDALLRHELVVPPYLKDLAALLPGESMPRFNGH